MGQISERHLWLDLPENGHMIAKLFCRINIVVTKEKLVLLQIDDTIRIACYN
jgi:hypothetical protein